MALLWENTTGGADDNNGGDLSFSNSFETGATDVIGYVISSFTVSLKRIGSPTGTITGHIWNNTNPNAPSITSTESYTHGDLTTSFADYTFTFISASTMLADYKAGITIDTLGTAGNMYVMDRKNSSVDNAVFSYGSTTTWTQPSLPTGRCFTMKVYGALPVSSSTLLPPPIAMVRL